MPTRLYMPERLAECGIPPYNAAHPNGPAGHAVAIHNA